MAQSMVNFRMDSDLKKSMEQVCKDMGMSMTTAFTIFATKVSREKRIPFEISADPFYSESNMGSDLVQLREPCGDHIGVDSLVYHESEGIGGVLQIGVSVERSPEFTGFISIPPFCQAIIVGAGMCR